jgi:hypothetical protein
MVDELNGIDTFFHLPCYLPSWFTAILVHMIDIIPGLTLTLAPVAALQTVEIRSTLPCSIPLMMNLAT